MSVPFFDGELFSGPFQAFAYVNRQLFNKLDTPHFFQPPLHHSFDLGIIGHIVPAASKPPASLSPCRVLAARASYRARRGAPSSASGRVRFACRGRRRDDCDFILSLMAVFSTATTVICYGRMAENPVRFIRGKQHGRVMLPIQSAAFAGYRRQSARRERRPT